MAFFSALAQHVDTTWLLIVLACVACADYLSVVWRAVSDEETGAAAKILLAALSAIGAVLARSTAQSLVAKAIDADPQIASNAVDLLTVLFMPLCIAGVASVGLALATLLPTAGSFVWGVLKQPEYTALAFIAVPVVLSLTGFVRGLLKTERTPTVPERRSRLIRRELRSAVNFRPAFLVLFALVGPLSIFAALDAKPADVVIVNLTRLLTVKMDFRAPGECERQAAEQQTPREFSHTLIATIPDVDDEVLVARVADDRGIEGLLALFNPPAGKSAFVFARERCGRQVVDRSPQSERAPSEATPAQNP